MKLTPRFLAIFVICGMFMHNALATDKALPEYPREQKVVAYKGPGTDKRNLWYVNIKYSHTLIKEPRSHNEKQSGAEFESASDTNPTFEHPSRTQFGLDNKRLKFYFTNEDDQNFITVYKNPLKLARLTDIPPLPVKPKDVPPGSKIRISNTDITIQKSKPKLGGVSVYKQVDDGKKWTLKSAETEGLKKTDKGFFGTTNIVRDTSGLMTKKLKYAKDRDWVLYVYTGPSEQTPKTKLFKKGEITTDSIIILAQDGTATIAKKGDEPTYIKKA